MTDPPPPTPDPVPTPDAGERRLPRAPSERYGATTPHDSTATADTASAGERQPSAAGATGGRTPVRGIAFGVLAALAGAALIVVFGGALAVSAGLLVVASAAGYAVGLATVIGAGDTLSAARPWIAAALAGIGVLLGQVGLWLFARAEGGVLAPIDYLGQTFGPLVPVEVLLAAAVAGWRAR